MLEKNAILFKRFANVDVFDIKIDTAKPQEFVNAMRRTSPTFGAVNLDDIKALKYFAIEQALKEQLDILILFALSSPGLEIKPETAGN